MMSVPVATATPPPPAPDGDGLGKLAVADVNAATGSALVGTSALKLQEFSKASDSSANVADSAGQGYQTLPSVGEPSASAAQTSSESSSADSSFSSTPGTSAVLEGTDTLSPNTAVLPQPLVATRESSSPSMPGAEASTSGINELPPNTAVVPQPLVATTDASSPSTPGAETSSGGVSELSQSNAVVGTLPVQGSVPTTGSTSAGVSRGTDLDKTGIVNAKATVDGVQASHITKVSSAVDHDGKHKASSSTGSTDSRDGGTVPALAKAFSNSSSGGNRSDNQRMPTVDSAAVQQQSTAPNQGLSAMSASSSGSAGSQNLGSAAPTTASDATAPGSLPEAGNVPAVSSAQLIQSIRHSEMRLGMQSDEFGSMSISTSLGRQSLSAQISTEHSELSRALAVHLPAIEQKLSTAYGVAAKVEVNSGNLSQSTSTDTSSGQQRQSERQQGSSSRSNGTLPSTVMVMPVTTSSYPADTISSRLDIRV